MRPLIAFIAGAAAMFLALIMLANMSEYERLMLEQAKPGDRVVKACKNESGFVTRYVLRQAGEWVEVDCEYHQKAGKMSWKKV